MSIHHFRHFGRRLTIASITWAMAAAATAFVVLAVGDQPWLVLKVLANSAFGSAENISYTLFYATPVLFTGTAVTIALEAGLFNIGVEGQLYMGALGAAAWGAATSAWFVGTPSLALVAFGLIGGAASAMLTGGLWAGIAGTLRARAGVHEVIATIMLNFIAMAATNWGILNVLKNPATQSSETVWIAESLRIPRLWHQTTYSLVLALFVSILLLWALRHTWWGFRVRATGQSTKAASTAGIATKTVLVRTMAFSGAIAGLVGFHEVYCSSYRLIDSFSPGFGFMGLAVGLLARSNPVSLIAAALMFGALHKGALDLDLETDKITRDLSAVIQALILMMLAAQPWIERQIASCFRSSKTDKQGAR